MVVLRALGLGDLLTAVPALRGLRRQYPHHPIALACPAVLEPLAALTGAVDAVVPVAGLAPLPGGLHRAHVAVNLHGRGPESTRLLHATGPRRLLAFAHEDVPASVGGPAWDGDENEVDRWCRLVAAGGAAPVRTDLHLSPPAPDPAWPPHPVPHPVIVHPGAAHAARRWPADRWVEVIRALVAAGRDVELTGGPGEHGLVRGIAAAVGSPRCRPAPPSSLLALAARVAAASLLVCGDTGPAHLATAFATPSVLLFGPTSPQRWGPVTGGPHQVLWAGSTGDPHGQSADPGLLAITVADVVGAVERQLESSDGAGRVAPRRSSSRPLAGAENTSGVEGGRPSPPASCSAAAGWRPSTTVTPASG